MTNETLDKYYDLLINLGVSEQTLNIVTSINGYNEQTLDDVLYVVSGYRTLAQYESELYNKEEE